MAFITSSDYKVRVRDKQLEMITNEDSAILATAESTAMAIIKDALKSRFDIEYIFARTGSARDAQVVRWMITLVMYFIYERVPDKLTPKRIIKNYDDTMLILLDVADGKKSLDLKRVVDEEDKPVTKFRWGSQPRRD